MGIKLDKAKFDNLLQKLKGQYKIFAPVRQAGKGMYSDTDLVTYGEIASYDEMELLGKPRYSPKEVIYPITQTMFYFTEEAFKESGIDEKGLIIFMRPCDANAYFKLYKLR